MPTTKQNPAYLQYLHGLRVEERQRTNHQPNGYQPITELELQLANVNPDDIYARIAAVTHPDPEVARALTAALSHARAA
jgi:hypothetical protein